MRPEELAYWAGFFDGEGHIELAHTNPSGYNRYGRYMFQVWLDQWTDSPDIYFSQLLDNFGGRVIAHKEVGNVYRWYISGENGRRFLEALLPYLRDKKRAAELGIELQKRMQLGRGGRRTQLEESEVLARDTILKEYFSLIKGNKPKRIRKLGRRTLVEKKTENVQQRKTPASASL